MQKQREPRKVFTNPIYKDKATVLVANGDNDRMVPSNNTLDLGKRISNSEIIVYKDAGHGGIFQYHEELVKSALAFLAK